MPQFDKDHVKLCGGILVWDGITRPETVQQGQQAGKLKYSVKVLFEPHNPDIAAFEQLAQQALLNSKWRGQLPPGGGMPIGTVDPGEFNDKYPGWRVISFKTTLSMPAVYDDADVNGPKVVNSMQLGSYIYPGQKVDILAHCYEYDAAGNKGISAGLDAVNCVMSAQMPKQQFGNGIDTAAAFGGGQQQPMQQQPMQQQPMQQQPMQQQPMQQQPMQAQAHNFLPGSSAPETKYQAPDGGQWTEAQLLAAGWQPAAIQALPRV